MSDQASPLNKDQESPARSLGDAVVHGTTGNATNARITAQGNRVQSVGGRDPRRINRTINIDASNQRMDKDRSSDTMNAPYVEDDLTEGRSNTGAPSGNEYSPEDAARIARPRRSARGHEPFKVIRVAFKVMNSSYNFRGYDELPVNREDLYLFEDEVFSGSKFYDLCRKKGQYKRYHSDFIQTYCCSLFNNTPFPSSVFVFVEEIEIVDGSFATNPCALTTTPPKSSRGISSFFDLPSFRHRVEETDPDYELFYIESNKLTVENGSFSQNEIFVNACSKYLRGSPKVRGTNFNKPGGFNMYADVVGMEFIKFTPYQGLVPKLKSSTTLVPLILLISRAIGYKYSLRRINKVLGNALSQKLSRANKLRRRSRKNLKDLNFVYCGVELFLTQSFLVSSISYQNSTAQDIFREILGRLSVAQDYGRIKEQMEPLNHLLHQLSIAEMIRGQTAIRFSIIALGFFMVAIVVVVSAILGVEPMVRLLNDLGLLPPNLLK